MKISNKISEYILYDMFRDISSLDICIDILIVS